MNNTVLGIVAICFIWLVVSVVKDFRKEKVKTQAQDHEERIEKLELRSMAHDAAIEGVRHYLDIDVDDPVEEDDPLCG